ncbi:hypothetical protein Tco_1194507 [Tanacetum coccineum]
MSATMKHVAANFSKLDKFEGMDFRRRQKKMHFFLTSMLVVYDLSTPIRDDGDEPIVEETRKRGKWGNVRIYQKSQENSQKMGKHGHEERKSTKEAKDSKPKPRRVNPWSNLIKSKGFLQLRVKMENSSDQEQDGKDKSIKSSSLIGSLMPRILKEAQEMMMFALDHSHKKHNQVNHTDATLAIRVRLIMIQGL